MAGFFGLFDFGKPGPGVAKDAPRKKGFVVFFEIYIRKFWKLFTANLLFVVAALPVVTVGWANAGLTFITRNFVREKHAFLVEDFKDTIKKNRGQALLVGILNLLFTALLAYNLIGAGLELLDQNQELSFSQLFIFGIYAAIAVVFSFMKYYLYLMLITFKLSTWQLYKNSLLLAFAGIWRNLLVWIVLALIYLLAALGLYLSFWLTLTIAVVLYIVWFPAFRSYLIQFVCFPVVLKHIIGPYYREHPDEAATAERLLGLTREELGLPPLTEEEQAAAAGDEPIFRDTPAAEPPASTIPRQYTPQELDRIQRRRREVADDEDDGTI